MKYAEELSASLNRTTTTAVCAAAVLTWFFSAMQCNKEYCYTTDNPITQVILASTLALATIMAATSAPVLKTVAPIAERVNHAKALLDSVLFSKKPAENTVKIASAAKMDEVAPTAAAAENTAASSTDAQAAALPQTSASLFSPKSDSVQANASESSASPYRSRSPSPVHA